MFLLFLLFLQLYSPKQAAASLAATAATEAAEPAVASIFGDGSGGGRSSSSDDLPGAPVPEADDMIQWIVDKGGQVNVVVRELPGAGRVTLAARDMKEGDILASIPEELCFKVKPGDGSDGAGAAMLLAELRAEQSQFSPYLKILPGRSGVRSFLSVPESYLPLIQNQYVEGVVNSTQLELDQYWQKNADAVKRSAGKDITYADMQYATDLLYTRAFDFEDLGEFLLPIVDMANHYNGCPHSLSGPNGVLCDNTQPQKNNTKRSKCVVWQAEADVAAGTEVCNAYADYMLQDRALLQYGFLQRDQDVIEHLSGVDLHAFDPESVWEVQSYAKPSAFTGTSDEMKAERARLLKLHREMTAAAPGLRASISLDPELDPDGSFLETMWEWRRQRLAAVEAEIERITDVLGDGKSGLPSKAHSVAAAAQRDSAAASEAAADAVNAAADDISGPGSGEGRDSSCGASVSDSVSVSDRDSPVDATAASNRGSGAAGGAGAGVVQECESIY